jgi:hypothetical protein
VPVGGRRKADAVLAVGVLGQQVAHGRGDRAFAGAADGDVAPLGVFDEHGRVDRDGKVCGQRGRPAPARRDARQRLGVAEQRFGSVAAQWPGGD